MIDPATRQQWRELANKATPGPWRADTTAVFVRRKATLSEFVADCYCDAMGNTLPEREPNAAFIAAARTAVPALLDALDAAEMTVELLRHGWNAERDSLRAQLAAETKRAEEAEANRAVAVRIAAESWPAARQVAVDVVVEQIAAWLDVKAEAYASDGAYSALAYSATELRNGAWRKEGT